MANLDKRCPIYTIGDGKRTQCACRHDGVWFKRVREHANLWGPWREQPKRPYDFGLYVDTRAGNARLPNA